MNKSEQMFCPNLIYFYERRVVFRNEVSTMKASQYLLVAFQNAFTEVLVCCVEDAGVPSSSADWRVASFLSSKKSARSSMYLSTPAMEEILFNGRSFLGSTRVKVTFQLSLKAAFVYRLSIGSERQCQRDHCGEEKFWFHFGSRSLKPLE
jgi:hypothetical protein